MIPDCGPYQYKEDAPIKDWPVIGRTRPSQYIDCVESAAWIPRPGFVLMLLQPLDVTTDVEFSSLVVPT